MDDLYLVLGVEPDAKPEEIRERFRFLAQAYHPDKFSSPTQKLLAEEEFKRINNAYQILSNPRNRTDYDLRRKSTTNYSRTNAYDVNRKAEEAARQRAQEEQKRKAEEAARQRAQEEQKRSAEEAARQRAQEEQKRRAEESARQHAQEEQKRRAEESARQRAQEEQKRRAEEAVRLRAQEEPNRKTEETARQRAQEKQKKKVKEVSHLPVVVHEQVKKRTEEDAHQDVMRKDERKGNTDFRIPQWRVIGIIIICLLISFIIIQNRLSSTRIKVETPTRIKGETQTPSSNQLRIIQTAEIKTTPIPFLLDDFSDEKISDNNWQFAADHTSRKVDISNGEMIVGVSSETKILYMPVNYSDVIIQTDINRNSGDGLAGLVCRMEEVYGEYLSLYYFAIFENKFIFNDFHKNDVGTTLVDGYILYDNLDSLLSENSSYKLTVKCIDNKFSAYINGILVAYLEVKNQLLSSGYVGVIVVDTIESEFSFDNFSISKP